MKWDKLVTLHFCRLFVERLHIKQLLSLRSSSLVSNNFGKIMPAVLDGLKI